MDGTEIMKRFLPASPYPAHLGIRLDDLGDGTAALTLPFSPEVVTIGETVHGGAIASLIDTAAMAAAWAGAEAPENMRGTTVGMTVQYVSAATKTDLVARARVIRRGRSLSYVEVDVVNTYDEPVAKGLVTYKLG